MPYQSDAQRKYFNANRSKLEKQGVDVDEWNQSSKGAKLPEYSKGEGAHTAKYAEGGTVLPRSGDWKKTLKNRGFLDTPDRFTGHKNDLPNKKTDEDWAKTGGPKGDVKPQDKSERPILPQK